MSSPHHDLLSPRIADLVGTTTPIPTLQGGLNNTPLDSWNFVKMAMFLLGIGAVITPNALLLCASYYREEYPNIPDLIYYIIPTYSISNIIFLLILSKWGNRLSFTLRIIISFLLSSIASFGIVQSDQRWDLIILLFIVFIIGMTSSILNRSLLGFTNILESSYKHKHISGEAISGIVATITRVITRICYGNDPVGSSNTYFLFIATFCIFCALIFIMVRFTDYVAWRLNIYILYMAQYKSNGAKTALFSPYTQKTLDNEEDHILSFQSVTRESSVDIIVSSNNSSAEQYQRMESMDEDSSNHTIKTMQCQQQQQQQQQAIDISNYLHSMNYKPNSSLIGATNQSLISSAPSYHSYHSTKPKKTYSSLLFFDINSKYFELNKMSKTIKSYCYIILISNILTWSIIPGLISGKIKSDLSFIQQNDWQSILLMSEYYISQYIGRLIISSPSFWCYCCEYDTNIIKGIQLISIRNLGCCPMCCYKNNFIINHTFLIWICIIRILFIYPTFIIIYINVLDLYWISHFLMLLIGVTQGYIYHITFSFAPQFVSKYKREAITSTLRFFHFVGIAIGSIIALSVVYIVRYSHYYKI